MSAVEKVAMNVRDLFWTNRDKMVEELESLDYIVTHLGYEYVGVYDALDENEAEYILYLGHAHSRTWVESVKEA